MAGRKLNSFFMLTGQVVGKAGLFLSLMIFSRLLTDSAFGELLLSISFGLIIMFLSDMGVTMLITRRVSTGQPAGELLTEAVLLRTVLSASSLLLITSAVMLAGYGQRQITLVVLVCAGFVFTGYSETAFALFRARESMVHEGVARVLQGITGIALAVVARIMGLPVEFAALSYLLREFPGLIYSVAVLHRLQIRPRFLRGTVKASRQLLAMALPLGLAGMIIAAGQRLDGVFLKEFMGDAAIAAYQQCVKLFEALVLVVTPTLVPGALFPALCRAVREGWGMARMRMAWMTELFLVIGIFFTCTLWAWEDTVLSFLWGRGYLRGIDPAQVATTYRIVLFTLPVAYVFHLFMATFIAVERQHRLIRLVLPAFLLEILLFIVLIPPMGTSGAAVAHLVFLLVTSCLLIIDLRRVRGPTGFTRGALRPLLCMVPSTVILFAGILPDRFAALSGLGLFTVLWAASGGLSIVPAGRK